MLEVIKEGVITSVDEIKGIFSTSPVTLNNLKILDLSKAIDFDKVSSEDGRESFTVKKTESSITHLILIVGGNNAGFVSFLDPINLNDQSVYQVNINYYNSYVFAQFYSKIYEQYKNHSENEVIEHSDIFTKESDDFNTVTCEELRSKIIGGITTKPFSERRKGVTITENPMVKDSLVYSENFSHAKITNDFSTCLDFYYNLEEIIEKYNEYTTTEKIVFDSNQLIDNTYLGYHPVDGLKIYTIIPLNIVNGVITRMFVIHSGSNNCNRVYVNLITNTSLQEQSLTGNIIRPIISWFFTTMFIVTGRKDSETNQFKSVDQTYDLNTEKFFEKTLENERKISYYFINSTVEKRTPIQSRMIFSESFDITLNGFAISDKKVNFISALLKQKESKDFIKDDSLDLPSLYFDDLDSFGNINYEYICNYLYLLKNASSGAYDLKNIHIFDNFIVRVDKENDFIYIYKTSFRDLEKISYNSIVSRLVIPYKNTFLQSSSDYILLTDRETGAHTKLDFRGVEYNVSFTPTVLEKNKIISYRGVTLRVCKDRVFLVN